MTPHDYIGAARRILDHLEQTQLETVEAAANLVVQALTHGGAIFVDRIGHGNEGDFIHRAGGLAAVQRFSWSLAAGAPVADCLHDDRQRPPEVDAEALRLALRAAGLKLGDVLFLSSVSGKNVRPVELALACREAGVKTVAMTSLTYTRQVESLHPSGKRLFEVADVVIDNGAPYGDAAVSVPGYDVDLLPVSGISMTVAGWLVWGRVMERMAADGDPATVFISINREGGKEHHDAALKRYNEKGY